MNKRIAKLYDQAIVLESNGDYVAGELNPTLFAELIVKECANFVMHNMDDMLTAEQLIEHFGVEK